MSISEIMKRQRNEEANTTAPSVAKTFVEIERKPMYLRMPVDVHQFLKVKAAQDDSTINDIVLEAILAAYPEISR